MDLITTKDDELVETSYTELLQELTEFSAEEVEEFLEKYPDFNPLNYPNESVFYIQSFRQTLRMRQFEKEWNQ